MFARKIYSNVGTFILMGHDDLVGNKVGTLVSLAGYKIGNWLADRVGLCRRWCPFDPLSPSQARVFAKRIGQRRRTLDA